MTSRKPVTYGAWLLAFLLVLPGHAKAGATSFALSCAEQPSASAGQPESDDRIHLSGTFTCAALTSPRAVDVIVGSQPWFVPSVARYYFYAYDRSDKPSWDNSTHKLIRLPKALANGERHLERWGRSTEEYFSDVGDGDCIVNSFAIFGRTTARAQTVLVAIENGWRDRSDPLHSKARPTKLRAFVLKDRGDNNYEFEEVAGKILKRYFCSDSVLPEVKAFAAGIGK